MTQTLGGIPVAEATDPMGSLVTGPGMLQYGQVQLGGGTAAGWRELVGWRDLPQADVADTPRPQAHGAYAGDVLASSQVVTFTYLLRGLPAAKSVAVDTLERYLPMDGVDRPLVVDDGTGPWFRTARVIGRSVPQGIHYTHAPLECSVQFLCADPRRYAMDAKSATLTLPAESGGLDYPLAYPLTYGTSSGGSRVVSNTGGTSTPPVLTFVGPLTDPVVSSSTGWRLGFALTIGAGESLVVDTAAGTAKLDGVTDRLYTITTDSSPIERCTLPPGDSTVALTAPSGAGTVLVAFRDARM